MLAHTARTLWIYFTAPPLGMLLAAERSSCAARPLARPVREAAPRRNGPLHLPLRVRTIQTSNMSTGMTHYDVIIIGTGAGGGTLAYRLAPSGKRILLARARRLRPPRKGQLELARGQRRGEIQHARTVAGQGRQAAAPAHELLRRRQHQILRRGALPAAGAGLRRAGAPRRPLAGVADWLRGRSSRTTPRPSISTTCTASAASIPTDPWASAPYRFPAVQHEPRIQQLHDDLARVELKPFHVPLGVMLDESDPSKSRCIRCNTCDGYPCLVHAKSDAQVVCVDPALEHPNVTLLTNAKVTRLETSASGREIIAGRRRPQRRGSSSSPPTSSCPPAGPSIRRRCCCGRPTTATRTAWRTDPASSAGTTWATSTRCCWRSRRRRTPPCSRRRWA